MVRVCDLIDDVGELFDDELRELSIFVEKELSRRAEQKKLEAKKRVMQAIQDYLAAGYVLHIEGEIEAEDEDYNTSFRALEGVIEEVHLKNNEVTLNFCEAY